MHLDAYASLDGKVDLNYGQSFTRDDRITVQCSNGVWSTNHEGNTVPSIDVARLSMKGAVEIGVRPALFFSIYNSSTGIILDSEVGVKQSIDFLFDATKLKGGGLYDAIKDSYCKTTIPQRLYFTASLGLFGGCAASWTVFDQENQWGPDCYILPLFSKPEYTCGARNSEAMMVTVASRSVLLPTNVGFRLYSEGGVMIEEKVSSFPSTNFNDERYEQLFSGLQAGVSYTVCPTVGIFNYTMDATPTTTFTVDNVVTGGATAEKTTAIVNGSVKVTAQAPSTVSIGVFYNRNGTPTANNSIQVTSDQTTSGIFTVNLLNLTTNTTYYYRAFLCVDGHYTYGDVESFKTKSYFEPTSGDLIDLGLSVKWASCNVGALCPEGYGNYYSWGELIEKSDYSWSNYQYYNNDGSYVDIGAEISGSQYDVARSKLGKSWRMPTSSEFEELCNKCTWKWVTYNGTNGQLITGPNGNSIFLPAGGSPSDIDIDNRGLWGLYWSGTLGSYDVVALCLNFHDDDYNCWTDDMRYTGRSVRPVAP